jgi:hypothetical protein
MPPSPEAAIRPSTKGRKVFERRTGKLYKKYTDQQNNLLCQTFYSVKIMYGFTE